VDSVLVSEIILLARQLADMENTQFVTDTELITYADQAYREFYDLLINTFQDYTVKPSNITLVAGQEDYTLPTDLLKLRLVRLVGVSAKPLVLRRFNLEEMSRLTYSFFGYPVRYITFGTSIRMVPTPTNAATLQVWYVPTATKITAVGQSIEVYNGYDEYIAVLMAMRMCQKEESDYQMLAMRKEDLKKRILDSMEDYNAGQPEKMTDIARLNEGALYPFFWGVGP
jgi:hypothetical protein